MPEKKLYKTLFMSNSVAYFLNTLSIWYSNEAVYQKWTQIIVSILVK